MVSIKTVRKYLLLRIQVIKDYIGIRWATGSENDNFGNFGKLGDKFFTERPDPDSSLYGASCFDREGKFNWITVWSFVSMDQGLIQV